MCCSYCIIHSEASQRRYKVCMCFKIESINRSMGRSQRQNGNKNNGDNKVRREKEKEIKKNVAFHRVGKKLMFWKERERKEYSCIHTENSKNERAKYVIFMHISNFNSSRPLTQPPSSSELPKHIRSPRITFNVYIVIDAKISC